MEILMFFCPLSIFPCYILCSFDTGRKIQMLAMLSINLSSWRTVCIEGTSK